MTNSSFQSAAVKTAKVLGYTAGAVAGALSLYLASSYVLSRIPVPKTSTDPEQDVDIYILSNGAHTDIVTPITNEVMDWSPFIKLENTRAQAPGMQYLAFGWGDKGFYLDTPTWAELKVSTAIEAMFYLGTSAMHTTFYREMTEGEQCIRIRISKADYGKLVAYIKNSFDYDADGNIIWIAGHSYGDDDSFYEAKRTYSFLYTCNTWANNALKACGQKASLWTAFDTGIFYQYNG
ncbi:TIGR02117 family protein [Hymenobacter saemangeumensis]|uniref:TIGR02117 family protein n=1 Tax=Hymenobacter saemangeumensis TaxID=1084522 RepID=A0ABP8ITE0_9BACT